MMQWLDKIFEAKGGLFFSLLWISMIMNSFVWRSRYGKFHKRFFEKMLNAFFFLIATNLIFVMISYYIPWFGYIFVGLLSVVCVLEITFYFEYEILFTNNTFVLLAETNVQEGKEFLYDLYSFKLLRNICLLVLGLLVCPVLLSPLFLNLWRTSFGGSIILFLIAFSIIEFLQAQRPKKRERYYLFLPFYRIWKEYKLAKEQMQENSHSLEKQKKIEEILPNYQVERDEIETLIFVIGESASRNYLEIYDSFASYLKNSPYMIERQKKGEIFAFDDVISSESLTSKSIPSMMTFKNYEAEKEWYDYPNVISILKKAGYHTYWISGQMKNETVGKVFSSLADTCFFLEDMITTGKKEENDETLITESLKILGKEKKKAIFFHIQGSHNTYSKRYPKKWDIDTAENIKGSQSYKKKKYIAEYSNSLRYTDYILEKILQHFSEEKYIFFYASDHSEELWEERDYRGHSGEKGSRYMIEIPMFIGLSPKIQKIYPDLLVSCKKSVRNPYMTDDIIHTILGTLGIYMEDYEEKRNVLSPNFDRNRKRMYQGRDYDTYWRIGYKIKV